MISNNSMNWLKLSILLYSLILILIGFSLGYIYNNYKNEACAERPLSYGIEKINKINNDSFTCSCNSLSNKLKPFYFNESGLYYNLFFDPEIIIIPKK